MERYLYGGKSDIGYKREINEDYISVVELDDDTLFSIISDGAGSKANGLNPASIVTTEITAVIRRLFTEDKVLFLDHAELFLKEAMLTANRVLGAFKLGNDELYSGFGASTTCCLLSAGDTMVFAHAGNTRLHLIRINPADGEVKIKQLTADHTKAKKMVDKGQLAPELYYSSPDSLVLTSGLGMFADPLVQTFTAPIQEKDFILLTTDGIHYAIQPDPMARLAIAADNCDDAGDALVKAAVQQEYHDNMSAIILFDRGFLNKKENG